MNKLWGDARLTLRQLWRTPGFTLTAVLTLALGIGANVIVFTVLDTLVLRRGNYGDPARVYDVQRTQDGWSTLSYPRYRDFRDRNKTFDGMAGFRFVRVGMGEGERAKEVWGFEATLNYFDELQVQPAQGRFFHASDEHGVNGSPLVVLSYGFWQDEFHGDPGVVGTTVRMNKLPYTVVGVAKRGFYGTERFVVPDFWVPVEQSPQLEGYTWLEERGDNNMWVIGHVKKGVAPAEATADLNRIAAQMAKEHPDQDTGLQMKLTRPGFLGDTLGGPVRGFAVGLMGLAALVLLAACANLGSLFAARTADRTRELAVRLAIGSTRGRIIQQLLTEAVVIAAVGGAAAYALSLFLLNLLSAWRPPAEFPLQVDVHPTAATLWFAIGVSLLTGLVFGGTPAKQILNADPNTALRSGGSSAAVGRRLSLRDVLLLIQIALCCVLVTASFVSVRGMSQALRTPMGFDPAHAALVGTDLQLAGYSAVQAEQFQREILAEVQQLPGVTAAGYANTTPLSLDSSDNSVWSEVDHNFSVATARFDANYFDVSPGYFKAAKTRMLVGRDLTWDDDAKHPDVAVVNEEFAKKLYGSAQAAVGHSFYVWGGSRKPQIVGVVETGKYTTLTESAKAAMFRPVMAHKGTSMTVVARTAGDPAALAGTIGNLIKQKDASVPLTQVGTWTDELGTVLFPARTATLALGVFGGVAMLLALTGIFGMASYTVSKRLRELSIRIALGANGKQVLRAALEHVAILLAAGSLAGLALGFAGNKVLASIVYQANAADPLVLLAVTVTMLLVGVGASLLPARRALRADPARLLREE